MINSKSICLSILVVLLFLSCNKEIEPEEDLYTFVLSTEVDRKNPDKLKLGLESIITEYLEKEGKPGIAEFKLNFKGWLSEDIYRVDLYHLSDFSTDLDPGGGKSISLRINFKLMQIREYHFQ